MLDWLLNPFALGLLAFVVAGVAVPLWHVWKWNGGWRGVAALPALVVVLDVLLIIVDTWRDPTSHNLWPFEIVMVGSGSVCAIGALTVVRRILRVDA
jgi:hypothetical protein